MYQYEKEICVSIYGTYTFLYVEFFLTLLLNNALIKT